MASQQPASGDLRQPEDSVSPESRVRPVRCGICKGPLKCTKCDGDSEEVEEVGDVGPLLSTENVFLTVREQNRLRQTVQSVDYSLQGRVPCPVAGCQPGVLYDSLLDLANHIQEAHRGPVTCPVRGCQFAVPYDRLLDLVQHALATHRQLNRLPSFRDISEGLPFLTQNQADLENGHMEMDRSAIAREQSQPVPALISHPPPGHLVENNRLVPQHPSPRPQVVHYSQDQPAQFEEEEDEPMIPYGAQPVTQQGAPGTLALEQQFQHQRDDLELHASQALLALASHGPRARDSVALGRYPALGAQVLAGTELGEQSQKASMEESTLHSEEQPQSGGQEDGAEPAAQTDEPPPFVPKGGDKCSMCMRSLPNKDPKGNEPSFEFQWQAHVDPSRNCRIPNQRGDKKDIPNRSGWLEGQSSRGAVAEARKKYRNKRPEFYKFYPCRKEYNNGSVWIEDPNNEANRENWDKPWPHEVERRLKGDSTQEAEAQGGAPGPSTATAGPQPRTAARSKRRAEASDDNAEYQHQSDLDTADDLESGEESRPPKRRRVQDGTYRPAPDGEPQEDDEVAESAPAPAPAETAPARGGTRGRVSVAGPL
ncbi:unnamed protein product [Clonostachys rosea]|uniref:C2H2-type domain-containing protein n=1 Tax=Bionectria ochroleuca TaxID=29856 RepID=A0ABY6UDZ5_BIOOC|nr:unnamed protein product [Clonostachys rosea]